MIGKNDIRYRAKCMVCHKPLGDWALNVKDPLCWKHKKWDLKKEVKPFSV